MNSFPYLLSFDVGGTNIKWRALSIELQALGSLQECPANSDQSAEHIVMRFRDIIIDSLIDQKVPRALCFGFPGPFDYEHGVSYMRGLGKYESLYGLNFSEMLRTALAQIDPGHNWESIPFYFENDATCFGLGEYQHLLTQSSPEHHLQRLACLTMGTGLGSAFIANSEPVRGQLGIPASGMVYDQLFDGRLIDEQFSRRGLLGMAREAGFLAANVPDVKDVADLARAGNEIAATVFFNFGRYLASALRPFLDVFLPEAIVVGGKIAQAMPLFLPGIAVVAPTWPAIITVSDRGSDSAIIGAATMFDNRMPTKP